MTSSYITEELKALAEMFFKSPVPEHQLVGRATLAFGPIVIWWDRELKKALESSDPEQGIGDTISAFASQLGLILYSCLSEFPPEVSKFILGHAVRYLEMETGQEVLPTREEVDGMIEKVNVAIN